MHGSIDFFIQRSKSVFFLFARPDPTYYCSRLMSLTKRWKRKWSVFREDHGVGDSPRARELIDVMRSEFVHFSKELPEYLRLKGTPSLGADLKTMSPPKRTSVPPGDRGTPAQYEPPSAIVMRCDLAISARYSYMMFCLPYMPEMLDEDLDDLDLDKSSPDIATRDLAPSAMFIIRTWQYIYSILKYVRTSMFSSYSSTKQLFDAAVILANCAIEHPHSVSARALPGIRVAADILRDPTVLAGRSSLSDHGYQSDEASKIIDELMAKADSA